MLRDMAVARQKPNIDLIARRLHVSKWHFCRTFKRYTNYTPRKYYLKCLAGEDPLILRPLPQIETKKNLQKKKAEALTDPSEDLLANVDLSEFDWTDFVFANEMGYDFETLA